MDMDRRSYGRGGRERAKDISDIVPQGGDEGVSSGRIPGRAGTRTAMRVHFWIRHMRDTVIILEEGNLPHPICPRCDMLVPWRALNG